MCVCKAEIAPGEQMEIRKRNEGGKSHFCLLVRLSSERMIMDIWLPNET